METALASLPKAYRALSHVSVLVVALRRAYFRGPIQFALAQLPKKKKKIISHAFSKIQDIHTVKLRLGCGMLFS